MLAAWAFGFGTGTAAAGPCDAPANPIVCENSKPGTPESVWQVSNDDSIRGFATEMSVTPGQTVHFKIKTDASSYSIIIYRLGYYNGDGARQWGTVFPSAPLPQSQPACLENQSTGLIDCGNWAESASWSVPGNAVSGLYAARLIRGDTGGDSLIFFVVRDDSSHSDLLFQTSDATWQAYNDYGGNSLYTGPDTDAGRAYKVSYNRPINIAAPSYPFNAEYPMIRWLEANGYDVSYFSGVDTSRRGSLLLNHKVFMSVGHDEYWSGDQRANVEAARAAGVNLAFFSGNEVFWKTRWENSIDGSNTPYRTLVTYKETHANAKIDPAPVWTGSWRDPRFSPPWDGGRPENALTGTAFSVNTPRNDVMKIPAAFGKLRFWRNTSVANLAPGEVASLPSGILGYEWDSDVDNGFRPAGLMDLSSTTLQVDTKLLDYGSTYGNGTATHSLTLYRAPSGALVFGAGTVQWAWGLDSHHDFAGTPVDQRVRQATVNLFADMGVQPGSLQAGLVPASQSTDHTAPTTAITSPAPGASVRSGDIVTVAGTASDSGGGVVGGVEVSTDGGTTWHPANGRESWTYSWTAAGHGSVTIKARAVDDSGNLESSSASVSVSVDCPCSLWGDGIVPTTPATTDNSSLELGVKFRADVAGTVSAIRFYKGAGNTGTHVGSLWASDGTLLARATFTNETASGWQEVQLSTPVELEANTVYVVSYHAPNGHYPLDRPYFDTAYNNGILHAPANDQVAGGNGVFASGANPVFPTTSFQASNYWVDVVFTPSPPDNTPPTVTDVTPNDGATGVSTITEVIAKFSEAMDPATVTSSNVVLKSAAGSTVGATLTYDNANRRVILDTAAALGRTSTYTMTIKGGATGVKDKAGNPLAADKTWSFTTAAGPVCPCSLWTRITTKPAVTSSGEPSPLEVGVKFTADVDGTVTGVRFYKGNGNTGTHVGSLWKTDGTLLARATYTNESADGWQQVNFATPVAIEANTTYIASTYLPNGNFPVDRGYFASAYDSGLLHAPSNGVVPGGNAVYAYGSAPTFPNASYQGSNYWADLVFMPSPSDTTPPAVNAATPSAGATGIGTTSELTAKFSEAMSPTSVSGSTVFLKNSSGAQVPATVRYDAASQTVALDPTGALTGSAAYTFVVKGGSGGVKDKAGNALASDFTSSFTTAAGPVCPCGFWNAMQVPATPSSGESSSIELGVRFQSDVDGAIKGVRFYKGSGNTGTHVGSLWSSGGTLLARATFANESADGWQQVNFASPVPVDANTVYVVSYFAPNGNFALDRGYFGTPYARGYLHAASGANGVYAYGTAPGFPSGSYQASNYWVDPVFTSAPPDTTPPTVASVSPAEGATGVGTSADVTATFSEAMDASTVNSSTVALRDDGGGGGLVAASIAYDAATRTLTLSPTAPLAGSGGYTVTVKGGTSGVKDKAGNALAADKTWSFTTAAGACPCTLWKPSTTPAITSSGESTSIEIGLRFTSDVAGNVTGVRFYKGSGNTGTHVGSLWTASGTLLARATFSGETASGWQQVNFDTPVAIQANTTYVVSTFLPNGNFSLDRGYFATPYSSGPLHAAANENDVYNYGSAPSFPVFSYQASNYWVDVVFNTS